MSERETCKNCGEDLPNLSQEQLDIMRTQVSEIHATMDQLAAVFKQMQGHPMLSAFMPRGL